jgi:hypothetical protein
MRENAGHVNKHKELFYQNFTWCYGFKFFHDGHSLMIINNFDVFCESIQPTKADSPLIIDANAALTGTISLECLKVIARWNSYQPQAERPGTSRHGLSKSLNL